MTQTEQAAALADKVLEDAVCRGADLADMAMHNLDQAEELHAAATDLSRDVGLIVDEVKRLRALLVSQGEEIERLKAEVLAEQAEAQKETRFSWRMNRPGFVQAHEREVLLGCSCTKGEEPCALAELAHHLDQISPEFRDNHVADWGPRVPPLALPTPAEGGSK